MRRLTITILLSIISIYAFAIKGNLSGKVVDGETGEELIGATVFIAETGQGIVTDLYGNYLFQLDPGTYTINVSYVSYVRQKIQDVVIESGNSRN